MFIVADQGPVRVGGKGGLAGARQAEEDRGVAFGTHIGGAMHRHDALQRQQVVQEGEDRLLHFTGIGRSADQHDLAGQVAGDDGFGAAAVTLRIGLEARQIDDRHFRNEAGEFGRFRTQQQVADEQRVPGVFGVDANRQPVGLLGAAIKVLREEFLILHVFAEIGEERFEVVERHALVVVPPHGIRRVVVDDHELVLRRPAGVHAGIGDQRSVRCNLSFAARDRMLVKCRLALVPIDCLQTLESESLDAVRAIPDTYFLHIPLSL